MNPQLLISGIVHQTTVLIAQLATAAGVRSPLAHVAADVFISLVEELKAQGLGSRVIADMFGLAIRTYHNRVRRYSESATDDGVSLWQAVLAYLRERGSVSRGEVLRRFCDDDETGLVFRSGRSDRSTYRAAKGDDVASVDDSGAIANLVWVCLHQRGPVSPGEISAVLGLKVEQVATALAALVEREQAVEAEIDGTALYSAAQCVISFGNEEGWEAALFDHYQAVVAAIAAKVRTGASVASRDDHTGGSTYHFDMQEGHPLEEEVLGLLARTRERASKLRDSVTRVEHHGEGHRYRVAFYVGQHRIPAEDTSDLNA